MNNSFASTWDRATGLLQGKARATRRKEMERKQKKKRCGFIMFVFESAAASCGIPDDFSRFGALVTKLI